VSKLTQNIGAVVTSKKNGLTIFQQMRQ